MLHPAKARVRRASPQTVARQARRDLAALARPAGEFDASRYFRGTPDLRFYNIGTSTIRGMARQLADQMKSSWSVDEVVEFAGAMLTDRGLEAKHFGLEVLARRRREFGPWLLPACKRWLAANLAANWATTDLMCGAIIGPLLAREPRLLQRTTPQWARHRNMWVRRASTVGLLQAIREGRALDTAYEIASMLHGDREDLIQKAVGWTLREAGRQDRPRLERYLRKNGSRIPRTTIRYAIEHFPSGQRRALLSATRP
jgi:3-methyladenine DNA glycosylase AlkD